MKTLILPSLIVLTLLIFGTSELVFASGGGGSASVQKADPDFALAQQAIQKKEYAKAAELLTIVVSRDHENADAHNLLGFAERMRGNLDGAFRNYERALAINPKHRGAHEYIGEAYLFLDNVPKAEEHLAKLDKICANKCEEYRDLKAAIADYKAKHPK